MTQEMGKSYDPSGVCDPIEAILLEIWPDQCELVGQATLARVVSAARKGESASEAIPGSPGIANFNTESVRLLLDAAILAKAGLDVWKALLEQRGTRPDRAAFKSEVSRQIAGVGLAAAVIAAVSAVFESLSKRL